MNILDNAKDIAELIKKYNDQELYQRIVDLRDEIFDLKNENLQLKENLLSVQKQQSDEDSMIWETPYYWKIVGEEKDGPFCQHCWDKDKKQIRLQSWGSDSFKCFSCEKVFNLDGGTGFKCSTVSIPRRRNNNRGLIG